MAAYVKSFRKDLDVQLSEKIKKTIPGSKAENLTVEIGLADIYI